MSAPIYTQFTERMYANLPEVVREADALNDYALKHYISAIGDVEDQVERLVARFTYLDKQDRLELDNLADDYSYYGLDYSYFQSSDSRYSAQITSNNNEPVYLRTVQTYRVVPNTMIYAGAVFRTDRQDALNTYGLRLWYYDAGMKLIATKDIGRSNGSTGPQWVAINSTDNTPTSAYYVRVSPFCHNTSGASATVWVDDVYVRSHYEVTTTNNLVSSSHNFTMRAEKELVEQGDFDNAQGEASLSAWSRGPNVLLKEKVLSGVPDIQSYRAWLELGSTSSTEPGYARQVAQNVEPSSTYTVSLLALRTSTVPDTSSVRVTITPNTGGPTVKSFPMEGRELNIPFLLSFTWNSPESVATAIVNIEYVTSAMPAQGLFINDVSMVRFNSDVTTIGRQGSPATVATSERAGVELFTGRDIRGKGWIRYETQGDPDSDPMSPSDPDIPAGTSFIEAGWHPTRPNNTYMFSGDVFSNNNANYADLIIWHRSEGKGWGEAMLHRLSAASLNGWVSFERLITIPSTATEFRVDLDVYRADSTRVLNFRNVSLKATSNRSWYASGSRPFAYNALATKSMNFLSRGDLLHYTANIMVTGSTNGGRYGIRVYNNGSQIIHETMVQTTDRDQLVPITGSFQVPESQAELSVALYVSDPTPKHQAAYFLSDLEVVHSMQTFVEDAQNIISNGGFEDVAPLSGWALLTELSQTRRNLVQNTLGPGATGNTGWRYSTSDSGTFTTVDGAPALRYVNSVASTAIYIDPILNFSPPVGTVIRVQMEVRAIVPLTNARILISNYGNATNDNQGRTDITLTPDMGWQTIAAESLVTAMPSGGYVRALFWPAGYYAAGDMFYIRRVLVEYNTNGAFFDKDTPNTPLATYSYDSATSSHVEQARTYTPPVGASKLTTGAGYNVEDVPARPEDRPLGATSDLVDPLTANTEWLPWLSQFAGKNISHFLTMDDARTALASGNNFSAGTIGAIQNAVQTVLSGTKTVRVFPMTTDLANIGGATQWDVAIVTRTSESPSVAVMEEAVRLRNAKPAGVVFNYHLHQSTWDAVELANPTWDVFDTKTWTGIEESGLGN